MRIGIKNQESRIKRGARERVPMIQEANGQKRRSDETKHQKTQSEGDWERMERGVQSSSRNNTAGGRRK